MVGDSLEADINGAQQMGIYGVWITRRVVTIYSSAHHCKVSQPKRTTPKPTPSANRTRSSPSGHGEANGATKIPSPSETSTPYPASFTAFRSGRISGVTLGHALDSSGAPATIIVSLFSASAPDALLARASASVDFNSAKDPRGPQVNFAFDTAVPVLKGQPYILQIETLGRDLKLSGSSIANETDYDFGLPFRVDGYDGFGGMYRGDLVLQPDLKLHARRRRHPIRDRPRPLEPRGHRVVG